MGGGLGIEAQKQIHIIYIYRSGKACVGITLMQNLHVCLDFLAEIKTTQTHGNSDGCWLLACKRHQQAMGNGSQTQYWSLNKSRMSELKSVLITS